MNEENERNKNTLIVKNIKNEKRKSFCNYSPPLKFGLRLHSNSAFDSGRSLSI